MISSRVMLVIIGIFVMVLSGIPLLAKMNMTISSFSIGDSVQNSSLPQNPAIYLGVIFALALIAVIFGLKSHNIIVH